MKWIQLPFRIIPSAENLRQRVDDVGSTLWKKIFSAYFNSTPPGHIAFADSSSRLSWVLRPSLGRWLSSVHTKKERIGSFPSPSTVSQLGRENNQICNSISRIPADCQIQNTQNVANVVCTCFALKSFRSNCSFAQMPSSVPMMSYAAALWASDQRRRSSAEKSAWA